MYKYILMQIFTCIYIICFSRMSIVFQFPRCSISLVLQVCHGFVWHFNAYFHWGRDVDPWPICDVLWFTAIAIASNSHDFWNFKMEPCP